MLSVLSVCMGMGGFGYYAVYVFDYYYDIDIIMKFNIIMRQ